MAKLLVIGGPIAAGKSTLARRVSERALESSLSVATIDFDDVARMVLSPPGAEIDVWDAAHEPFAELVGAWLRSPIDLVIAHGSLYTPDHIRGLTREAPEGTTITLALLRTTFEAALGRVRDDTNRGLSRDPDFLRSAYEAYGARLAESDVTFDPIVDTEVMTADEAAQLLAERVL